MTGLAFLAFLLIAAFLYARSPQRQSATTPAGVAVMPHPAVAAGGTPPKSSRVQSIASYPTINPKQEYAMAQQGNFPLDNLTFDLITILHEKSKGLEAYDKYIRDAQNDQQLREVLERIRQDDHRHINELQQHLQRRLGDVSGRKAA